MFYYPLDRFSIYMRSCVWRKLSLVEKQPRAKFVLPIQLVLSIGGTMAQYPSGYQHRLVNELLLRLKSRGYFEGTGPDGQPQQEDIAKEELENRLLNSRAQPEYEVLKGRILDCTAELNKYLDFEDQFKISVYLNCTSVRFRNRVLVMEFKQVPFNDAQIHHSLDLIFQVSSPGAGKGGRTTLVLARRRGDFVWRQLQPVVFAPATTSKDLAVSLLRWLEDGTDVF